MCARVCNCASSDNRPCRGCAPARPTGCANRRNQPCRGRGETVLLTKDIKKALNRAKAASEINKSSFCVFAGLLLIHCTILFRFSAHADNAWAFSVVSKILATQEYCGDVINFKTYTKSYKSKRRLESPPENKMIFEDVCQRRIKFARKCRLKNVRI